MIARTHRVSFYTPPAPDADPYASGDEAWTPAQEDVPVNLQSIGGDVRQVAAGRDVDVQVKGFAPSGTAVSPDQGVLVTEALGADVMLVGRRYRVKEVAPMGARWDIEFLLGQTEEAIP